MPTLYSRLGSALEVTGTSLETLCSQAVLGGIVGLFLPVACWGVISLGGLRIPLAVPVCGGVLLAGAGVLLPIAVLWTEARRRRRETRRVVGTFLDLVVLCLAGGMGIEGALHAAAQVGDDDVSARLLAALTLARDSGDSPWDALAGLGTELGVSELPELAAAVKLAGTQGARIRSTLWQKRHRSAATSSPTRRRKPMQSPNACSCPACSSSSDSSYSSGTRRSHESRAGSERWTVEAGP